MDSAVETSNAIRLLTHYFRILFKASGLRFDGDVEAEVGDIVGHIVSAAQAPLRKQIEELEQEIYEIKNPLQ